jgi:hypothetical protein
MRLLARDGWSSGELKMTMHVSRREIVRNHVCGQCAHTHEIDPVTEWDGYGAEKNIAESEHAVVST